MKTLINLIIEKNKLNSRFGMLSCLQYPNEYDKMDALASEIDNEIENLTNENDISFNGLKTAIENIADDIAIGNISESAAIEFYDQDAFIDYLARDMGYKEGLRFKDMLNWMNEKERAGYIETRFILEAENNRNNTKNYYHDERLSFVIVVG